jgi:hypothetical protein
LAQFQCGLWLLFERYNIAKHDQNKLEGEEEEERLCLFNQRSTLWKIRWWRRQLLIGELPILDNPGHP